MAHAKLFRTGFIQDLACQFKGDQYIMASAWFNYAEREIPPTLTQDVSEAVQTDRSWRLMALWKDYNEKNNLEAKLAWFNEFTRYDDPPVSVFSTIESQTVTGAFEGTFELTKNSALFGGMQYTFEYADLVNYEDPQEQQHFALLASYRHSFPSFGWQATVNGRQELQTGYDVPFLFSAGAEGKIWRFISGRFSVSRNFRAPTLNERFWQPGGNPDLEPEESWNEEISVMADYKPASSIISMDLTFFNSKVTNWILWLPGSSYWSVENAQEVWSRGVEVTGKQTFDLGNVSVYFTESYTFSKSTNRKKLSNLDASNNKQLIYTPLNRFFIKTGTLFRGYNLALKGNYTGIVYTTKDNLDSLPGYFLMDVVLSKTFSVKEHYPVTIQLNLNNILNKDYKVIPYRPMPGVNGMLTVKAGIRGH
jgi:iron complex outermembrane receptor protein